MGARFIRVYTILPPSFYDALLKYNTEHADMPLYLIQGVYLPDETYIDTKNLYDAGPTAAFTAELQAASDVVSGAFTRTPSPGHASGTWTADVSPWLAAWVIGAELEPAAIHASDITNASAPEYSGKYFSSVAAQGGNPTTSTERWLAARMDELATSEANRGRSMPIAFANWPTDDPLKHPSEPRNLEDMTGIDANNIQPTANWPGGTFADYHAYPYYPDFLRYQEDYQVKGSGGVIDAYEAYLLDLKAHHAAAGVPTLVGEFGVPTSIGKAHLGTNGRDEGGHSEQEAMQLDADMMRMIKRINMAGALLFEWTDEWFKLAWNVSPRTYAVDGERRALWHDALNKEQWFGVVASDPDKTGWRTPYEAASGIQSVSVNTDPVFLYVKVKFSTKPTSDVSIGFDILPSGGELLPNLTTGNPFNDVAVVFNPTAGTATSYIRDAINPIYLDNLDPTDYPQPEIGMWDLQRLSLNRSWPSVNGYPVRSPEFQEIGNLVQGSWNPDSSKYNSTATWNYSGTTLNLRLPWSMLAMADPSSNTALDVVDHKAVAVPIDGINLVMTDGAEVIDVGKVRWEGWNSVSYTERTKSGAEALSKAWKETSQ